MNGGVGFKLFLFSLVFVIVIFFIYTTKKSSSGTTGKDYTKVKLEPIVFEGNSNAAREYVEPGPAGGGSTDEEMSRLQLYLAVQQAVCKDIRVIGGKPTVSGKDSDGAWRICYDKTALQMNPESCIVYSFGISTDWTFDEEMEKNGCQVFAFDPSIGLDDHQHTKNIKFFNMGLSDSNADPKPGVKDKEDRTGWKMRSLDSIIQSLGHSDKVIDVLKMDIESDEWKSLPQMLSTGTLQKHVKQLCVEYHVVDESVNGLRKYYGLAKWLERQGFLLFNKHQNSYCPQCLEMSYVNVNLIKLPVNRGLVD